MNDRTGVAECLDDVLITAELAHRPSRAPDYERESRALGLLAQEMAANPGGILDRVVALVIELCRAESAGISLLEPGNSGEGFRWHAVAGAFEPYLGTTLPRDASPCGTVIDRDAVLLFAGPERCFPSLRDVQPRVCEALLAPWQANGKAVGTLWAVAHGPQRRFDAEDARLLVSLARFAAAAYQMTSALAEAKAAMEVDTVGVVRFDEAGRITEANDAFLAMSGYDREDLKSDRLGWRALTPAEWMGESEQAWAELEANGRTTPYEKEYIRKDGSRWWALFAAKMLPGGTIFEFVLDITERKQAEDALRASEARLQVLVAELQHRTRNLLSVVRAVARQMVRSSDSLPSFLGRFNDCLGSLSRAQDLVSRSDHEQITIGTLIRMELDALGAEAAWDRIALDGSEVPLHDRPAAQQRRRGRERPMSGDANPLVRSEYSGTI
jgi:PAS domain S-box-containing protein